MPHGMNYGFVPTAEEQFLMDRADVLAWEAERWPQTLRVCHRWISNAARLCLRYKRIHAYLYLSKHESRLFDMLYPKIARRMETLRQLRSYGLDVLALPAGKMEEAA